MDSFVADRIFVDAPPQRVFQAFVDPEEALVWLDAEGVVIEPRLGGSYRIQRPNCETIVGTISELVPAQRLVISACTYQSPQGGRGPSRIILSADPSGAGTWLNVRHEELDGQDGWQAFAQTVRRDWVRATVALKRLIEGI